MTKQEILDFVNKVNYAYAYGCQNFIHELSNKIDRYVAERIQEELDKLIPMRYDYHHDFDTPTDAAGHIKSAICGTALTLIVHEGRAMLGSSQGIIFCEFDGPRSRKFFVKVIPD